MVTAPEMRLYPVRELYAGDLFFPIPRAAEVLHAWREWTATVPDDVTSMGHILRLPPLPELPESLRGRAFAMVEAAYLGDAGSAAELTGPLRRLGPELDTFAMIPASALGQLNIDPSQPVPGEGDGAFLADVPAAAMDALIAVAGPDADTPLLSVEVRHLGGALARPASDGGAQPSIDAKYVVFAGGLTPTPELASAVRGHAQAVKNALASWHASYDYYNFEEAPAAASEVLTRFGELASSAHGGVAARLRPGIDDLADVIRALDEASIRVTNVQLHAPTLDDVFLVKTGRSLEGAAEEAAAQEEPGVLEQLNAGSGIEIADAVQ